MPDAYTAWANGVRAGNAIVTNGPLVEIRTDEAGGTASATASFYRPLERLEIVRNGQVIASATGDGRLTRLTTSAKPAAGESCWIAARVIARKEPGEPDIQAHTNPLYILRNGKPVSIAGARQSLAAKWKAQLEWYRTGPLVFETETARREFLARRIPIDSRTANAPLR